MDIGGRFVLVASFCMIKLMKSKRPKARTDSRRVAIFDIDGTIFRSSLLIELVDALIQEGVFPADVRKVYEAEFRNWLDRRGSYEDYIVGVIKAFLAHIKGVKYKDFLRIAKNVTEFHKNRVYRYTRDLVAQLKSEGYYMVAISNSPREIVEEFAANVLGFQRVYGRVYEVGEDGEFTGVVMHLDFVSNKAKVLRNALEKEGLSLKGSVGVGDSEADAAFLRLVDRPICFNPNSVLYAEAMRRGWEVVVERKDVIYKLSDKKRK
jgi:HAD superfamily hydrolase (TIGR01490 family)